MGVADDATNINRNEAAEVCRSNREAIGRAVLDAVADGTLKDDGIIERRGCRPTTMVSDNGTELTSHAILRWQEGRGVLWHYIAPGGAAQGSGGGADGMAAEGSRSRTGLWKSFNGRFRDECLNEHLFSSLAAARRIIEAWRVDYNTERPHTSLNGLTPTAFATRPNQGHTEKGLCP